METLQHLNEVYCYRMEININVWGVVICLTLTE